MSAFAAHDALIREIAVLACLIAVLLLIAVVTLVMRRRRLPVCWNCGFPGVRWLQSKHLLDTIARVCLVYPHRCDKCFQRYYCFRSRRAPEAPGNRAMTAGRS
jgi:hypothetical protein